MFDDTKLMSFTEHLEELRKRITYCAIAVAVGVAVAYAFKNLLFGLMARPLVQAWNDAGLGQPTIHFSNPVEPFFTYLKLALTGGIFLASPAIFYQLWKFVAPGLLKNEKRYVIPFTVASALCFIGGACFGYVVVFPVGFQYFLGFAREDFNTMQGLFGTSISLGVAKGLKLTPTLMMGEYYSLVWRLLFAFGIVFELPVLICFLALVGLVTHKSLWRWNPYFAVFAFIIGGILTPTPDILTQSLMAGPLIVLYNLSIAFAWILSRRRARPAEPAVPGGPEGPTES